MTGSKFETKTSVTRVDVGKRDQVDSWIDTVVTEFGRLDGAANIAGIADGDGETTENIVSL